MPIINADAKAIEWAAAVWLSKDPTGYKEIVNNYDIHRENQTLLKLPDRLTAKTFLFRLIYGGSAYAYSNDPDFTHVSRNDKYWQGLIDRFYEKYSGLHKWHSALMNEVVMTSKLTIPTGRVYEFKKDKYDKWPRTKILNYPVQGLAAELMSISRVSLFRRLKSRELVTKLVCTVHDSIVLDGPSMEVQEVCDIIHQVFADIPRNFESFFGVKWDLPLKCEIQIGPENWGDLIKEETYHASIKS